MSLKEALKLLRLELGVTQVDFAKKLGKAFVTVNRWENGNGFPSRENAKTILEVAKNGNVSNDCYLYLKDMLMPDLKRMRSASVYGFPDIDREFLFMLADSSMNSLYVIEKDTYNLLYANRNAEKTAIRYLIDNGFDVIGRKLVEQQDKRCFHYFANADKPCSFCPLKTINTSGYDDIILRIPNTDKVFKVHARAVKIKNKDVYVIYLFDISDQEAERNALYKLTNDIASGVGIYNVYKNGRIELVFMNEAFYKMIGAKRREDLLKNGDTDLCLIHPNDRDDLHAEIKEAEIQRRQVSIDLRMKVINDQFRNVHLDGKYIKGDEEKITYYCVFTDLDEQ